MVMTSVRLYKHVDIYGCDARVSCREGLLFSLLFSRDILPPLQTEYMHITQTHQNGNVSKIKTLITQRHVSHVGRQESTAWCLTRRDKLTKHTKPL